MKCDWRIFYLFLLSWQSELFENIKPLFANKPLIVCANKVDVKRIDELSEENQVLFSIVLQCYSVFIIKTFF